MDRLAGLLLALALTIAASHVIKAPANAAPDAVARDAANPYAWSDLGATYRARGDAAQARYCYRRAVELSGAVPRVLLDAAIFYFDQGDSDQALPLAARIARMAPDYDAVLFGYFDRFLPSPAPVFMALGVSRRPVRAYTQHLIDLGDMKSARLGWRFAEAAHLTDDRLASSYLDGMILRAHDYEAAQHDWAGYLGTARGDYPQSNLLFNGGFEREPTGSLLDWRIQSSDKFETGRDMAMAHSGKSSLEIRFLGIENVDYRNVSQMAVVSPGPYYLQAWIRAEHITTNEGPRLEVVDAENPARLHVRTDSVTGTNDWKLVVVPFVAPQETHIVTIRVVRAPSLEPYNTISGTYWLDEVRLSKQ